MEEADFLSISAICLFLPSRTILTVSLDLFNCSFRYAIKDVLNWRGNGWACHDLTQLPVFMFNGIFIGRLLSGKIAEVILYMSWRSRTHVYPCVLWEE